MYTPYTAGTGSNGLAVVIDSRKVEDRELDSVLECAGWLKQALGKREAGACLRVAIRDAKEEPYASDRLKHEVMPQVWTLLREHRIKSVIIVSGGKPPKSLRKPGREAWAVIGKRPGSSYKWAGTALYEDDIYKVPILPPWMYEPVYSYLTTRWCRMALLLAQGKMKPFQFPPAVIHPGPDMVAALEGIFTRGEPLGVDIETNLDRTRLTVIGLADSKCTVSIPWDGFHMALSGEWEPSLNEYSDGTAIEVLVRRILAGPQPKILHNGSFDLVELAERHIEVSNYDWDTLLLHRVVYPQYPHGLQFAAATELCVPPWKALYKPPQCPHEFNDTWDPWTYDPVALRTYNAQDAAIEVPLLESLRKKAGV